MGLQTKGSRTTLADLHLHSLIHISYLCNNFMSVTILRLHSTYGVEERCPVQTRCRSPMLRSKLSVCITQEPWVKRYSTNINQILTISSHSLNFSLLVNCRCFVYSIRKDVSPYYRSCIEIRKNWKLMIHSFFYSRHIAWLCTLWRSIRGPSWPKSRWESVHFHRTCLFKQRTLLT